MAIALEKAAGFHNPNFLMLGGHGVNRLATPMDSGPDFGKLWGELPDSVHRDIIAAGAIFGVAIAGIISFAVWKGVRNAQWNRDHTIRGWGRDPDEYGRDPRRPRGRNWWE